MSLVLLCPYEVVSLDIEFDIRKGKVLPLD
jgi:hypothetical protein